MATESKQVENIRDQPIDDIGNVIQLAHDVEETKNSPWTKSMFRLCKSNLKLTGL